MRLLLSSLAAVVVVAGCEGVVAEGEGDVVAEGEGEGEGDEGEGEGEEGEDEGEGEGEGDVDVCVFAPSFREMLRQRSLPLLDERRETDPDALTAAEQAQLLAALHENDDTDVVDVAGAFDRVDQGEVRLVKFWSLQNDAAYDAVEYGRGDTSVGAVFAVDDDVVIARVNDGGVEDCVEFAGDSGGACADDADCDDGHVCQDVVCVPDVASADGEACVVRADCVAGDFCGDGECEHGFFAGSFDDDVLAAAQAEGGGIDLPARGAVARTLAVSGLGAEVSAVQLFLFLLHDDVTQLTVTLRAPDGTEVVVAGDASGGEIFFDDAVDGFAGAAANGDWAVAIEDDVDGGAGQLLDLVLRVGSRG